MKKRRKNKGVVSALILFLVLVSFFGAGAYANSQERQKLGRGRNHSVSETGADVESEESKDVEEEKGRNNSGNLRGGSSFSSAGKDHGKPSDRDASEEGDEGDESPDPFDGSIPETELTDGKLVTLNIRAVNLAEGDEAVACVYKLDDGEITFKKLITLVGGELNPAAVAVPVGNQCFVECAPVPGYQTPPKQTIALGEFKGAFSIAVELEYIAQAIMLEEFYLSFDKHAVLKEEAMLVGEEMEIYSMILPENTQYDSIAWASSNSEIAMVENGIVTALSPGEVTISAQLKWGEEILGEDELALSVQELSSMGPLLTQLAYETGQRYALPMTTEITSNGLTRVLDVSWTGESVQHLDDGDYLYFTRATSPGQFLPVDAEVELYGSVFHQITVSGLNLRVVEAFAEAPEMMTVNRGDEFDLTYRLPALGDGEFWNHTDLTGFYFTSSDPSMVSASNEHRTLEELEVNEEQVVSACHALETGFVYITLRNSEGRELASWGITVVNAVNELVDYAYIMASTVLMGEEAEEHFDNAESVYITCKNLFDEDQFLSFQTKLFHVRVTEKGTDGQLGLDSFRFDKTIWRDGEAWRDFATSEEIDELGKSGAVYASSLGVPVTDSLDKTVAGFKLADVVDLKPNTNASKEVFIELSLDPAFPAGDIGDRPKTYHVNIKIGSAVPSGLIEVDIENPEGIPVDELIGRHVILAREEFPNGTTLETVSIYDFYQEQVPTYPDGRLTPYADDLDIYADLYTDEVKMFGRIASGANGDLYVAWEDPREIPLKIGGYLLLIDYLPYKTDLQSYNETYESMLKEVHLTKSGELIEKTVTFYP